MLSWLDHNSDVDYYEPENKQKIILLAVYLQSCLAA